MVQINEDVLKESAKVIEKRLKLLIASNKRAFPTMMNLVAADLLDRAVGLAPVLTGDLVRSARVAKTGSSQFVIRRLVTFGTDHAVVTHEVKANPGPITRSKPNTADGTPGYKYLLRPFRKNSDRYIKFMRDGLQGLAEAAVDDNGHPKIRVSIRD